MLLSMIKDLIFEKKSCKRYAFVVFGSDGLEIVRVLLIEVVVFLVQVSIIQV